ncbi:Tle1 phospholipase domain-containing protein [Sphingomonas antarctica]|uniref:DUF2235 domain-containing protein n=1 Tax=Sphingomonas antarctica TaxID=2040274 RepID=UPI0039E93D97
MTSKGVLAADSTADATVERRPKAVRRRSPQATGRNLVVMLDGTGNELGRNLSNVLKLFRIAEKGEKQLVYYNPGVGTIARVSAWHRARQKITEFAGLTLGYGLDDNVLGAYRFLAENWREGDRIFLFGFSRGAWTARILAGFIHLVGLVRPEQLNMSESALGAYKRAASENDLPLAWHFSRVISARLPTIHFVGVWDTVGSVIVPRPDRFYVPSLETLPYTVTNPSVRVFRHALALDERRRMFRVAKWKQPQPFVPNRFKPSIAEIQDTEQRWFPGVHSDVGGGYPEVESALSKQPLIWMVEEAAKAGLRITKATLQHLAYGQPDGDGDHDYVAPSPAGQMHRSLKGFWWVLEFVPKLSKYREWAKRWSFAGLYIPAGEPRAIDAEHVVDSSVGDRQVQVRDYRPVNIPKANPSTPL